MHVRSASQNVVTKGLCHVAIRVNDLGRSIRFYTDLFNLTVAERGDEMAFLKTPGKDDSFALFKSDSPVSHGGDLHHFGFFVDDENFKKALEQIREGSIRILGGPGRWSGGAQYVYIEDPDGYRVQISTE